MPVKHFFALWIILCFACGNRAGAQLVVNEFSQGASGNKEYIELVVKGVRTCNDTSADIRGWIFDDNNGWYGTTAISPGSYRFKNDPNWANVPYGSLIVIYNSGDLNANLPAADPTDANGDRVYVVPISSSYLEMHNTLPSGSSMNYPSSGWGPSTTWTNMALNNTNDAVQTVDPANLTASYHAVSYGSGVVAPVHISTSGSQKVYYLSNDQYNSSAAWVGGNVPADETPGQPNTPANATWINGMLNGVGGGVAYNDTLTLGLCQGDSVWFIDQYYYATIIHTETFTSSSGCDSILTLNLTVNPIPLAPQVVSPLSYCQDEINVPALTATGANLLWYAYPFGGTGSSTAPVPATNVAGTFMYYVSQTVGGCESPRDSIEVKIIPKPAPPVVTTPVVVCQGAAPVTLTAQGQNLLWYDQPVGGTGNPIAPVIPTGAALTDTWYVSQTVNGCESLRNPIDVRVSTIHAAFSVSTDTLCISDSLLATNLSTGNNYINYWNFGDGFTYVNLNQAHRYDHPGIFNVWLAVTNSDGCTDTAEDHAVWVSPLPEDMTVSQDIHDLCTGDEVKVSLDYLQGFSLLTWDFGYGNSPQQLDDRTNDAARNTRTRTDVQHAYDVAGKYFITVTAYTPGCPSKEWHDSVIVHPMPQIDLGPDTSICLHGNPILLKNRLALPEGEIYTYVWSTGETTPEILVKHHGDISLTVKTSYCSNTEEVHVAKDCYIDVPNAFTPNNDGSNDYFFPRQLLSSSVSLFQMQVLNRWGQVVYETTRTEGRGWDGRFNGKDQPEGVYIYLIKVAFTNGASESYQGNVTLLR